MNKLLELLLRFFPTRTPRLLEGLPHPDFEAQLFTKEQQRGGDVMQIHGSWFYRKPITVAPELLRRLLGVLADPTSFVPMRPFVSKRCGGFHADYAVEWLNVGVPCQTLLCFGCGEAKIISPLDFQHYDLSGPAEEDLASLLKGLRQLRPTVAGG